MEKKDFSALFEKLRAHKCEHRINDDGSVTFFPSPYLPHSELAREKRSKVPFAESVQYENIMKEVTCDAKKLEAIYDTKATVVQAPNDVHGFIACLELAFFEHYPMALSPSVIWLLILQSLGMHIDNNAEKLRDKFVTHQDKKELTVDRPSFVKGSPDNAWDGVIEEFVAQIDKHTVEDVVSLLETDFSTTSAVERIAGKVAIMDLMKHYFVYRMAAGCGFPQITLTGTKKDWVAMKQKLTALLQNKVDKKFGKSWADAVMPVLDRFIDAFDGKIDCLFWNSMFVSVSVSVFVVSFAKSVFINTRECAKATPRRVCRFVSGHLGTDEHRSQGQKGVLQRVVQCLLPFGESERVELEQK